MDVYGNKMIKTQPGPREVTEMRANPMGPIVSLEEKEGMQDASASFHSRTEERPCGYTAKSSFLQTRKRSD